MAQPGRRLSEPNKEGILHNLEEYDMTPMSMAGEKVVTDAKGSMVASLMSIIIARLREKKIPLTSTRRALGHRSDWLLNIYGGTQRDAYLGGVLGLLDSLGLEVVVRLKPDVRSSKVGSLKGAKAVQAVKAARQAAEQAPKVILVETPAPVKHTPTGVIDPEVRQYIDGLLGG